MHWFSNYYVFVGYTLNIINNIREFNSYPHTRYANNFTFYKQFSQNNYLSHSFNRDVRKDAYWTHAKLLAKFNNIK